MTIKGNAAETNVPVIVATFDISAYADLAVQAVQILFWITLAVTAVLTYRQARRSIFQPMKNEIFKNQIEELKAIITIFLGKDDLRLGEDASLPKALEVNAVLLYDEYAFHRFGVKVDPDTRRYSRKECSTSLVSKEYALNNFTKLDGHTQTHDPREPYQFSDWKADGFGMISVPDTYDEYLKRIMSMAANPLLPAELAKLLTEYCDLLRENIMAVMATLNECQNELEDKYETLDSLRGAAFYWIHNKYRDNFKPLEPKAKEIISFIRSYVNSDAIFK